MRGPKGQGPCKRPLSMGGPGVSGPFWEGRAAAHHALQCMPLSFLFPEMAFPAVIIPQVPDYMFTTSCHGINVFWLYCLFYYTRSINRFSF